MAAKCSGVKPSVVLALMFAPRSSSALMHVDRAVVGGLAAACSGV
jgi:hypothetical protein